MKLIYVLTGVFLAVIFSSFVASPYVRSTNTALVVNDSTSFSPNSSQGWSSLFFYQNQVSADSATFEIILQKTSAIQASAEIAVGAITNNLFKPLTEQRVNYQLLPANAWSVRITTGGQCYIRQIQGTAVPGNSAVLPVKIKYRNK